MRSALSIAAILLLAGCGPGGPVTRPQAPSVPAGVESFSDCADCPTMIVIPARKAAPVGATTDEFAVLWERRLPSQRVAVDIRRFAIGQTEITIDQFNSFVTATGYQPVRTCQRIIHSLMTGWESDADFEHPGFPVTGEYPAGCMRLEDAQAYVGWLSRRTGHHYRLPTEAEWEYVARGGTANPSYLDDPASICRFENVRNEESGLFRGKGAPCDDGFGEATAPVAYFKPNPFGVYDMLGNVTEWVFGCLPDAAPPTLRPFPVRACVLPTSKGGSYTHGRVAGLAALRVQRWYDDADTVSNRDGFRVVRDLD